MSKVLMTVKQIQDLGLWDRVSEYLHINPYALNEGQISEDEVLEFDSEFKKEEWEDIKAHWMRFKATSFKDEDGEKIRLDLLDYPEGLGFEFYKDELNDVIKVLELLKERL